MELLLHETLEEEATSSQPIPDPLLPRVVNFIREFNDVFLETIGHCARKTELALWPHLFESVQGNPRDLFQACLDQGLLDTAASYLLVLQTLDRPSSRRYASSLLEAAEKNKRTKLVADLKRFLESIDPSDFESPPTNKPSSHSSSSSHPPLGSSSLVMMSSHVKFHGLTGGSFDHVKEGSLVGRKRTSSSSAALMLHSPSAITVSGPQSPPINFQVNTTEQYPPASGRSFSLTTRKLPEFSRRRTEARLLTTSVEETERESSPEKMTHGKPMAKVSRSISEPMRRNSKGSVASDDAQEESNCHSHNHVVNSPDEEKTESQTKHEYAATSTKIPGKPVSLTSNGSITSDHPFLISDPTAKSISSVPRQANNLYSRSSSSDIPKNGHHLIQVNSRRELDAASIHSTSSTASASQNCIIS